MSKDDALAIRPPQEIEVAAGDRGLQLTRPQDFHWFGSLVVAAGIVGAKELQECGRDEGKIAKARESAVARAVISVQYGAELGLPPMAALRSVNVINGKPALSAASAAALIQKSPQYAYKAIERSDKRAVIDFFEKGKLLDRVEFTMEDARRAGLTGANWRKFPRRMLWARAMTEGATTLCPEIFYGSVTTVEELNDGYELDESPAPDPYEPESSGDSPRGATSDDPPPHGAPAKAAEPAEPMSEGQRDRLCVFSQDERLPSTWRKTTRDRLKEKLAKDSAQDMLKKLYYKFKEKTGKEYNPLDDDTPPPHDVDELTGICGICGAKVHSLQEPPTGDTSGEPDVDLPPSDEMSDEEKAEVERLLHEAGPTPSCDHPEAKRTVGTDQMISCGECGEVLGREPGTDVE